MVLGRPLHERIYEHKGVDQSASRNLALLSAVQLTPLPWEAPKPWDRNSPSQTAPVPTLWQQQGGQPQALREQQQPWQQTGQQQVWEQ